VEAKEGREDAFFRGGCNSLITPQAINKSLSALGNVISALYRKERHIPFRDSKLTQLLRPSLGGDCKALMFCNLSPSTDNLNESLCSLRFAKKVGEGVVKAP
jgi:hypothetical protein